MSPSELCSVLKKRSHAATPIWPSGAYLLNAAVILRDEVHSLSSSPATCCPSSCCVCSAGEDVGTHRSLRKSSTSCSLVSTERRASSSSSPLKLALAFENSKSERRSDPRTIPVAPLALVADMHSRDHRQCAGEPMRGMPLRSSCRPSLQATNFSSGIRILTHRTMPPESLNVTLSPDPSEMGASFRTRGVSGTEFEAQR
mmetsp:Transcript_29324/g.85694  ORF Transcript_29324/g.85694 Transcript_29324/m.85694 type:complete len:200 (+) Transcript_29324:2473-3072(+)